MAFWRNTEVYWLIDFEGMKAYGRKTIHRNLEGVRAKNLQATLLFVDFTKAFHSIHRGRMEQILLAYGLPKDSQLKHQSESTFTG